ncbi:hypothetical protein [Microbacterium gorillae]|uniref:hypothetical protein n=1 Tax=Microbacterium gorillae TaxID=1231063 RepID=UPI000A5D57E5|nr:hypothetical protein [Microbacterium gorillae]
MNTIDDGAPAGVEPAYWESFTSGVRSAQAVLESADLPAGSDPALRFSATRAGVAA